ncbi:Multicopper oxidase [Enhygromyxa salina]|uniref:Multicopper oxidase n=1 Tax=Enhygromyxa salina TaxID=215803 RepID=A0A0C2D4F0_9BACT|nr:copper oxidase [Enhygromyxa salina]KIG16560.1 Multicopper oxidase [Enhygromyxa salina]
MTRPKLTRRQAVFAGAALTGGAALLASREAQAAPGHNWDSTYSGGREPRPLAPGAPGRDYKPTLTPGGSTLSWSVVEGVKVYHLIAEEVDHEFAPGVRARCWGYNGSVHGPTIEAVEGDRVRVYVTNRLSAPTTVHWHGVFLPSGMDGVGGLSQRAIAPGETFRYEWTFKQSGTFMYHSHHDEMTQMAMGMMGMIVVHPRNPPREYQVDRDFVIMLSEWKLVPGAKRPDPNEMSDFNVLTMNAKAFPGTAPLVCRKGDRVRIRFGNLSAMDHHPIHLHGYYFKVVATDGGRLPTSAQWPETTVLVAVGSTRDVEFVADAPGDWAMHCHMTHHVMNQMGHELPNMIGVEPGDLDKRAQHLVPGYMSMGMDGMGEMGEMDMPVPPNSFPMVGAKGPFDYITMGGMFTLLKVRDHDVGDDNQDPGWYKHPPGTVADLATTEEMKRDGINA